MSAKIENTGAIQVTVDLTLPLSDWQKLLEQLQTGPGALSYPGCRLAAKLREMIQTIEKREVQTLENF